MKENKQSDTDKLSLQEKYDKVMEAMGKVDIFKHYQSNNPIPDHIEIHDHQLYI